MLNLDFRNDSKLHSYLKEDKMNIIVLYAYRNQAFINLLNRINQKHINVLDDFVCNVSISSIMTAENK